MDVKGKTAQCSSATFGSLVNENLARVRSTRNWLCGDLARLKLEHLLDVALKRSDECGD